MTQPRNTKKFQKTRDSKKSSTRSPDREQVEHQPRKMATPKPIVLLPQNENQKKYITSLRSNLLTFGAGPAGVGKTYIALAVAAMMLQKGEISTIYVIRSPLEAGRKVGYLPGELDEKIDPYFTTVRYLLNHFLGAGVVDCGIKNGKIVFAPFTFLRSCTIDYGFVLIEEAQNTTITEMKLALSRVGKGTRFCVAGDDLDQSDLPEDMVSGFTHAAHLFSGVDAVGTVRFTVDDIVRSDFCKTVIMAYRSPEAAVRDLAKVS